MGKQRRKIERRKIAQGGDQGSPDGSLTARRLQRPGSCPAPGAGRPKSCAGATRSISSAAFLPSTALAR